MTELDFDELDKAVNDLMKDVETPPSTTQAASAGQADQNAPDTSIQPQPAPVAAVDTTPPPAFKRRGKFMDVVAPVAKKPLTDELVSHGQSAVTQQTGAATNTIADITPGFSAQRAPQAELPAGDEAQPITPSPGVRGVTEGADEPDPSNEREQGYAPDPAPVQDWPQPHSVSDLGNDHPNDESDTNDWPTQVAPQADTADAPEQASDTTEPTPEPEQPTGGAHAQPQEPELVTVVQPDEPQPDASASSPLPQSVMASPFLPGAKVEKRPLGGEAPAAGAPASGEAAPEPLPREYGSDLLSLESDTSAEQAMNAAQNATPAEPAGVAVAPPTVPTPVQASTATTIFDTDTYHTPLKQPAKAKNGWLTLIWILALLIIGAVAGAAYYFYTIQH